MARYTKDQLIQMARHCQAALASGDSRYIELLSRVSMRTGLDMSAVSELIAKLANSDCSVDADFPVGARHG